MKKTLFSYAFSSLFNKSVTNFHTRIEGHHLPNAAAILYIFRKNLP